MKNIAEKVSTLCIFCITQSAKINRHENIHADKNRAEKLVYSKWFLSESRDGGYSTLILVQVCRQDFSNPTPPMYTEF